MSTQDSSISAFPVAEACITALHEVTSVLSVPCGPECHESVTWIHSTLGLTAIRFHTQNTHDLRESPFILFPGNLAPFSGF